MALEIRRLRKKKKSVRDMHSPFTTTVQNTNGLTIVFGSSGLIIMNEKRILFFLLLFCMDIEYEKKKKKKETPSSSSPGIGVFRPPTRATLSIPNYPGPG